ncbi:hypothetical protein BDV23DRAFT_88963 [Aspergillus alliaceus]|uniref:Secreted protein n=1 Tax=Petromyces alliaceus TaxID=209559 RepID=A0A5N7C7F5_PETAA|nr:hypothetical protein BDV23DRAFT_88963 [Aspergillus alliaceus]
MVAIFLTIISDSLVASSPGNRSPVLRVSFPQFSVHSISVGRRTLCPIVRGFFLTNPRDRDVWVEWTLLRSLLLKSPGAWARRNCFKKGKLAQRTIKLAAIFLETRLSGDFPSMTNL